jgi:hypothetical protein
MVIGVFYAVCGLSVLFFAAFLIQCCRLTTGKPRHISGRVPAAEIFDPEETTRLLGQWEQEMSEFMARQGRSTAPLLLIAAGSLALLSASFPYLQAAPKFLQVQRCGSSPGDQASSLRGWEAEQNSCKKS